MQLAAKAQLLLRDFFLLARFAQIYGETLAWADHAGMIRCLPRQNLYRQNISQSITARLSLRGRQSRVARQTQSIASGCSGSRAQSAQRGTRSRSSP